MAIREIAYKISIKDIKEGKFVEKDDEPSFLTIRFGNIRRCNLMGLVIAINKETQSFILDDGSSRIEIKQFEEKINLEKLVIGSAVQVIGRPRVYNKEIYVVAEIIKEINKKWLNLRKEELKTQKIMPKIINSYDSKTKDFSTKEKTIIELEKTEKTKEIEEKTKKSEEIYKNNSKTPKIKEDSETNKISQVLNKIKELDKGEGASIDDVAESFEYDADTIITNLLSEGEIYEIKPGKIKVLE